MGNGPIPCEHSHEDQFCQRHELQANCPWRARSPEPLMVSPRQGSRAAKSMAGPQETEAGVSNGVPGMPWAHSFIHLDARTLPRESLSWTG